MKSFWTYYNFILISILTLWGFFNPFSNSQLIGSILLYPLFVYFALQVFPKRQKSLVVKEVKIQHKEKDATVIDKIEDPVEEGKFDSDRRMFLKLIGSAGLSLFLFTIFTRRFETNFFNTGQKATPDAVSLKDKNGKAINPAEKLPTDGYRITQLDDSATTYYGFMKDTGAWFIMREDTEGAFRYARGDANFASSWSNRTTLNFDYFENVF